MGGKNENQTLGVLCLIEMRSLQFSVFIRDLIETQNSESVIFLNLTNQQTAKNSAQCHSLQFFFSAVITVYYKIQQ